MASFQLETSKIIDIHFSLIYFVREANKACKICGRTLRPVLPALAEEAAIRRMRLLVRRSIHRLFWAILVTFLGVTGCGREGVLKPAAFPTDGVIFLDEFGSGVTYQAFANSKLDAVDKDITTWHTGSASISVIVPDSGNANASYAGGAFTTDIGRNLSGYDALTFWAKADTSATLNVVGIGNDNTGTSVYTAQMYDLPIGTNWTRFVIPIPLPEKLTQERGLFYFAEGPENGFGYEIWFDEIQYESLGTITSPAADIGTFTIDLNLGEVDTLGYVDVSYNVAGVPHMLQAMPGYLTFTASNSGVVSVGDNGVITGVGQGSAKLTAKLGTVDASGSITVNVSGPDPVPTSAAPIPTVPAADVISLFSDVYTDVSVTSWSADWPDDADVSDETVASDNVKKYTKLVFAGIEFTTPTIDASGMTRFHMDIWTPKSTAAPATFKVKLVDFGANNQYGGGDDVERELSFTENTAPAIDSGIWVPIDLPLEAFFDAAHRSHVAQLILSGDLATLYVDNVYFYNAGPNTTPTIPAPTPTKDPGSVISLLSDVYSNVTVDTWSSVWDYADVQDFVIDSDSMKEYTNLTLAAIECRSAPINVTAMTHFHMDIWTPDFFGSSSKFKIKLVDFGANGVYDPSGGDDVSHEIALDRTKMFTSIWVGIDIRLSDFIGLTTKEHIGQLILSGDPNTVFVDNIYFYDSGLPSEPTTPAPTPSLPQTDVISLFSDVYSNVPVDTWSAPWDTADVSDFMIGSDHTKHYSNLFFAGIEFTSSTIDASAMNYFHIDVWTPDPTNAPAVFKIKLVDFGADGAYEGGDDAEHELTFDESTMNTGSWVSLDIPLADFVDLATKAHLAQLVISGDPNTIYIDNVYLHK